jgi:hypothetical protein
MGHLQQIDPWKAARHEDRVDRLLDVAREKEAAAAGVAQDDDRDVVDPGSRVARLSRHCSPIGPQDPHPDLVEREAIAGREPFARSTHSSEGHGPGLVPGTRSEHARLEDPTDPVACQEHGQARDVVLVGMAEDQEVDPPIPRRQPLVERNQQAIRIRPAVDQHPPPVPALHEDRVALPDVERGDPGQAVRSIRDHENDRPD